MAVNGEIAGKEALEGWVGPIMDGSGLNNPPSSYLKLKQLYETKYGTGPGTKIGLALISNGSRPGISYLRPSRRLIVFHPTQLFVRCKV